MLVTSPYLRPPAGQTVQEGCPRCDHCSILNNAYCFHEDGVSQNTYAFIVFDNAAQNTCEFIDFVTVASRISTHSAYDGDAQNPYNDMPSRCKRKEDLQKASSLVCCTLPNRLQSYASKDTQKCTCYNVVCAASSFMTHEHETFIIPRDSDPHLHKSHAFLGIPLIIFKHLTNNLVNP